MTLLGDDGRGYELARKLESEGVWRTWLGDELYPNFAPFLASPSSWEVFMKADDSKPRAEMQLQLRVRALLFDKAIFASPQPSGSSSSAAISKLNPNYLQLHGDDIYFTLEDMAEDGTQQRDSGGSAKMPTSKMQPKAASNVGSRYVDRDMDKMSQRFRSEEFPESWYSKFFEEYRATRSYKLTFGEQESDTRTPEQMSEYLRILDDHKRRRVAFKEEDTNVFGNSMSENTSTDDETCFFPETMFPFNCVPDTALPPILRPEKSFKVEFNGVLDNLPPIINNTASRIQRLGIGPEYLSMEQGGRGKTGLEGDRKLLSPEQASEVSRKVVARVLANAGFEGSSEMSVQVLSQLLTGHMSKLGGMLKVLSDSYRKECTALELIKMFLQVSGNSNLEALSGLVRANSRNPVQQTPQQLQLIQAHMQSQRQQQSQQQQLQQAQLRHPQQVPRSVQPQMQQMVHPAYQPQLQQQWEKLQRLKQSVPRPGAGMNMNMDNVRPMVKVKQENQSEFPVDNNAFGTINARNPQMQFRQQQQQQQLAGMGNFPQSGNQFRQMASHQMPQVQSPNMSTTRAQPVKVEGFQELMGGDASLKHDSEESKLTSPSK